jgi:hypothetical protein
MQVRINVSMPSLAAGLFKRKLEGAFVRARMAAAPQIQALLVDRINRGLDGKLQGTGATQYRRAIMKPGAIKVDDAGIAVEITDPFVVMLEKGTKAFDMKPKLLAHAKHSSKGGTPYVDVPFHHAADSIPSGLKKAMAKVASRGGRKESTVRNSVRTPGRSFTRALLGKPRSLLGRFMTKKQAVQHKRGIHDDLIRRATPIGKKASVSYTTVRRVSAKSAPGSWWHPGMKGIHLVPQVLQDARTTIIDILRDNLSDEGVRVKGR